MRTVRVIPRLDIKSMNLVKGIRLEGLRIVGDPGVFARRYYDQGADELLFIDVYASLLGRDQFLDLIKATTRNVFIPLTVGGGIRSVEDIVDVLRAGADKVAINTAAIRRPEFISEASRRFGSQCIVASIEAKFRGPGRWEALTDNGREITGLDVLDWAKRVEALGAGEILLTSVDREGTRKGYDRDLLSLIRSSVRIPVIASGGAGSEADIVKAVVETDVDAISAGWILHFQLTQISKIKAALEAAGTAVRPVP
jgi:cyclase